MAAKELTAKSGWRPAAMWVFIIGSASWLAICAYLVLMKIATVGEVAGLVMTIIAGLSAMAAVYTKVRSDEKKLNKHEDELK